MYVEEPWKGSVLEVHHKRTTDGSDFRVMDPNDFTPKAHFWSFYFAQAFCVHLHHHNCELGREEATATGGARHADNFARAKR